jgi:hypothetical protein
MIIVDHPFCCVRTTSIVAQDSKCGEMMLGQGVAQLPVTALLVTNAEPEADPGIWSVVIKAS